MRHNGRTPLMASRMRPEHLSLHDNEPRMAVCPDCLTWHRLTRSMITPHRAADAVPSAARRYFGDKPSGGRRCPGSAQRINIDISIEAWGERLHAADSTASGRRAPRQHSKPTPATSPAVAQMQPAHQTAADAALTAYRQHRTACQTTHAAGRCTKARRCAKATRLSARYERLQRTQPRRDQVRQELAAVQTRMERRYVAAITKGAAAEWGKRGRVGDDEKKATAKRGGATVEEANNTCRIHPADTVSEYRGPEVPFEPLRIGS
ncbi:hypothetical protein [Streptomyces sp. MS2.AVA.5]|uniref:Uncharacterized protein n=1 Tax=Streptomyces achmelvichensis TaxID=3134111 RepID=A0ACC6PL46_9ACTN